MAEVDVPTVYCLYRFRVAGQAEADAQQHKAQLQKQVVQLQQQLQDQASVLVESKEQVCCHLGCEVGPIDRPQSWLGRVHCCHPQGGGPHRAAVG